MFEVTGILDKIISMADPTNEFENIWQLKAIRFDLDPEDERKKIQKNIHISYNVQDIKGNPGIKGQLFLTNLRVIWQATSDRYTNFCFGIDTIVLVNIKPMPISGGVGTKYLLTVKCESLSQTRYQFKFIGYTEKELAIFNSINSTHKKAVQSKNYRNVNLSLKIDIEFAPLQGQEVKSTYDRFTFYEDNLTNKCKILLTNVRIVIIRDDSKALNYGIPWIMIKTFQMGDHNGVQALHLSCRGYLNRKRLFFYTKVSHQLKRFYLQIKSFGATYNKTPTLGLDLKQEKTQPDSPIKKRQQEVEQIEETRINLKRRKNAYSSEQSKGSIENTQFNEELGLMMEALPEGTTRLDLWELLRD